jgi:glutamine amidotransferase
MMHNGTLFDFPQGEKYRKIQKGSTDSERMLLYIIDKINEFENDSGLSSAEERFNLINDLLSQLADGNKLNIMIYDGELTYVHSNMRNCLYTLKRDDELVIASSPVNDDENWMEIEINTVYGIVDGNVVFKGKNHGKEFIFTEEHEKIILEMIPQELRQQYLNSQ